MHRVNKVRKWVIQISRHKFSKQRVKALRWEGKCCWSAMSKLKYVGNQLRVVPGDGFCVGLEAMVRILNLILSITGRLW